MFILIQDGKKLLRVKLNSETIPYKYKGIEITDKKNRLYICLHSGYFFKDRDKVRRLEEKEYIIEGKDFNDKISLYVYKDEQGLDDYCLYDNEPFVYISSNKGNIINKDNYLKSYYLIYKDKTLKTNAPTLLINNRQYNNEILENGDFISFYNFMFFYYDDYLYMNNFRVENKIKKKEIVESIVHYKNQKPVVKNYLNQPLKEIVSDEILTYNEIKPLKNKPLVFQIGPSLTMTLAMVFVSGINIYNNYLQGQDLTNSIVYMIMPIMMIISGVLWPILTRANENKTNRLEIEENKKTYLEYLNEYRHKVDMNIKETLKEREAYFFKGDIDEDKLFYVTDKSPMFLSLSIGHIEYNKEIKYKTYKDEDINESLNSINYVLKHIENYPYFLDLKKYHLISFVINKDKIYFIKKFILELSYKNHYDDFYIGIYSKNLDDFYDFFNIPQIIRNNNRLTFYKAKELHELNNSCIDKPLILFMNDKIEYKFNNPNICVVYFVSSISDIYKDSEIVIEYKDKGIIHDKENIEFKYVNYPIEFKECTDILANYQKVDNAQKQISFNEVFKNYDISSYYNKTQSGLRADFAYTGNELLAFDLHEKGQGPHGLIGGSTGSGKSELIVSLLLSLCIRYRPDYLNIILIDYKGGGIKESLSYNNHCLPHIIGSIDNLEPSAFERLIVSIDSECKYRQKLFKELSSKTMTSIMSLDDYLDNDFEGFNLPKIAHLLIVVDEFAELKKENPTIIKELISFSRIGRSLGLHLLLATQRPNGAIDDEIWSNSHFKIALKVLSEKDSNDIIKQKDAAYINEPGKFYLSVDDELTLAKSFYSKKDVHNKDDYEVSLLDNQLNVLSRKTYKQENRESIASYVTSKIIETTDNLDIEVNYLDFKRPNSLTNDLLRDKYKFYENKIVFGEIDDYLHNKKGILALDEKDNIIICSTRKNEINNILNQLSEKTIVIGSHKYINEYISDSLVYDQVEDIDYLFKKLSKSKDDLTLVIEDYNCLSSYIEDINMSLISLLKRKEASNINIICLSKQTMINFKLLNCFDQKLVIEYKEKQDLLNIFSCTPCDLNKSYYQKDTLIGFVPSLIEDIKITDCVLEPFMDYVPDDIEIDSSLLGIDIKTRSRVNLNENQKLLITGDNKELLDKYKEAFKQNENVIVSLYDVSLKDDKYDGVLWLEGGLFRQRLFYYDEKQDLQDGFAYLLKGNKGTILKVAT